MFLAVSTNQADPTPHLAAESARVGVLMGAGEITHIWVKTDYSGAVLVLSADDEASARDVLGTLPLVQHDVAVFDLIPSMSPPGP